MESELGRLEYSEDELLGDGRYARSFDRRRRALPRRLRRRRPLPLAAHRCIATPPCSPGRSNCCNAGHTLIDIPESLVPPQYPSVEQAKLLLKRGVKEPVVRALTVISILEGFGAIIRDVRVPELQSLMVEPLDGHRARAPRQRLVRSARARRGRLQGSGRAQADVGSRARPRAREPEGAGRRVPALDGRPRSGARVRPALPAARQEAVPHAEHDEPGARDRGVRARHVRLGRDACSPMRKSRPSRRRPARWSSYIRSRRIAARRVPAHGAVGSAHAHAAHRGRRHDRRQHRRRRHAAPGHQAPDQRPPARAARRHAQRRDDARSKPARPASRCSRSSITLAPSWTPPARTGFEAAA